MTGEMDMRQLRNMVGQALKRKALETGTEDSVATGAARADLVATVVDLAAVKADSEEVKATELVVADLVVIVVVKEDMEQIVLLDVALAETEAQ